MCVCVTRLSVLSAARERIGSLERQLAIEVEQRKQAEALNERLHQQMVEAQRQMLVHSDRTDDAVVAADVPPDFTLVSKDQLHSLLLE